MEQIQQIPIEAPIEAPIEQIIEKPKKIPTIYECIPCKYKTKRSTDLRRHMASPRHNLKVQGLYTRKMYPCPDQIACKYTTKSWGNLQRHKKKHLRKETKMLMQELIRLRT